MNVPFEHDEQKTLIRWAELSTAARPELGLLHAIPNGGPRNKVAAVRLKAEGVKPGVPDLFLPVPRKGYHGMYIELKRRQGSRVSPEQREWKEKLQTQGYRVDVCKGFEAARDAILDYLT